MYHPSRRDFLRLAGGSLGALALPACATRDSTRAKGKGGALVNDVHSKLNATRVAAIYTPASADDVCRLVAAAASRRESVCVAGGRHAMGGQQFAAGGVLLSTERLAGVLAFDGERGEVEVAAGTCWPQLIQELEALQAGRTDAWGIIQKQTGADRLSIGGALASNVHGRSLARPPFVADVVAFTLVDARGRVWRASRDENSQLFRLAAGGYGLFGIVTSVRLRLMKRTKVRRVVEVIALEDAMDAFAQRIRDRFLYGDFQYGIDLQPADGRWVGVFSCYEPVPPETPLTESPRELSSDEWLRIVGLCHVDPAETVRRYTGYYLSTSGQVYWSDTHQLSVYVNDYHARLDAVHRPARAPGSEMITEVYVPRDRFVDFMHAARRALIAEGIHPIYGTVRLVERDEESFLRWAVEPWACIIWNLHVEHDDAGLAAARRRFVRLIDEALERSGSYYLTYHRWARKDQIERAYPQMREFLRRKRELDPEELFQSDWYRHYRSLFAGSP